MAPREMLEAVNNTIDAESQFADCFCNGSLYYYDKNHQFPRPLQSEAISTLMVENLHDARASEYWNAGFVCGWLMAMCENNPKYFFSSLTIPASVPVEI